MDKGTTEENTQIEKGSDYKCSRLIIKNLPKHLTEAAMLKHFSKDGEFDVTDSKICRKGAKSR